MRRWWFGWSEKAWVIVRTATSFMPPIRSVLVGSPGSPYNLAKRLRARFVGWTSSRRGPSSVSSVGSCARIRRCFGCRPEPSSSLPQLGESTARLNAGTSEDVVETVLGDRVRGIDFGVREWVLDLPAVADSQRRERGDAGLLREWMGDHGRHLDVVLALASGTGSTAGVRRELLDLGVVRGRTSEELKQLRHASGGVLRGADPGVVWTLYLRRDGRGLLQDSTDPNLASVGFRLAGGSRFIERVRAR